MGMSSTIERLAISAASFRFEPVVRVGAGQSGEVWKAKDQLLGGEAALKVALDEEGAAVLAQEAERLADAVSPRLPEVLDLGRLPEEVGPLAPGRPFLAMTWLAGRSLAASA